MAITEIRIKNFRSIVEAVFRPGRYNVLVGQNDSGKSNFLRALNLFFNDRIGPEEPFRFARDYSTNARQLQRKAPEISVELVIAPPPNFTMNNEILWRRAWRKESDTYVRDERFINGTKDQLSGRNKTNSWLDLHKFRYVPAVRGGDYFRTLMRDVHDVLAESFEAELRDASTAFITDIRQHTKPISDDIQRALRLGSELRLPPDLRNLFEVLDFETDGGISYRQRGDGIQAFHVPAILQFLAEAEKKLATKGRPAVTTIWAYEEPENNLEFSRAFAIADDLNAHSVHYQTFVTTHSPAFYAGENEAYRPSRWNVSKDSAQTQIAEINSDGTAELHGLVGFMPLIAPFVRDAKRDLRRAETTLSDATKPMVLVSGKTDEKYFRAALDIFAPSVANQIAVRSIAEETAVGTQNGGDGNLDKCVAVAKMRLDSIAKKVVVIYDCDAKKKRFQDDRVFIFSLEKNEKNTIAKKGIENLFGEAAFTPKYYSKAKARTGDYGESYTSQSFNKVAFCETMCAEDLPDRQREFALFQKAVEEVLSFFSLKSA